MAQNRRFSARTIAMIGVPLILAIAAAAFLIGPPPDKAPSTSAEPLADTSGADLSILDPEQDRTFDALIWEPNAANDRNELVVISHGYSGRGSSHSHLAEALAERGYTVVASTHPDVAGLESDNPALDPLVLRPRHLSLAIDAVESDNGAAFDSVMVVGHSLGGYSALRLAGAEPQAGELLAAHCSDVSDRVLCTPRAKSRFEAPGISVDVSDPRVDRIVLLAPGYGPLFTAEDLAISVPVLVAAAKDDSELPGGQLDALIDRLPSDTTAVTVDGGHYVFLRQCTDAEAASAPVVCKDPEGVDRDSVNDQLVDLIADFAQA